MGFFNKENLTEAESGNWNTAENYSKIKIMSLLAVTDEYEELAEFGSLNLYEEMTDKGHLEEIKLRAFRRLINHLIRICNNSFFALKKSNQDKLETYKMELKNIRDNLNSLVTIQVNSVQKTKEIKTTSEYAVKLERVSEIKKEINVELNKGDLIFIQKDTFNPKEFKEKIFKDAIERG